MRARPAPLAHALARSGWSWCVWLALVAVGLQAPSVTVRHCHAGGSDPHSHGAHEAHEEYGAVANHGLTPAAMEEDLALPHGHRVVWGFDLHEPTGCPADSPLDENFAPVGVISGSLAPVADSPEGMAVALPRDGSLAISFCPLTSQAFAPKFPPYFPDFSSVRSPVLRV